jgi:hypothetical protein
MKKSVKTTNTRLTNAESILLFGFRQLDKELKGLVLQTVSSIVASYRGERCIMSRLSRDARIETGH